MIFGLEVLKFGFTVKTEKRYVKGINYFNIVERGVRASLFDSIHAWTNVWLGIYSLTGILPLGCGNHSFKRIRIVEVLVSIQRQIPTLEYQERKGLRNIDSV